jgi:hypothetical protein
VVCACGWTSTFAIAPALGAAGLLAADEAAVEVLFEGPLVAGVVAGVEDAELLSASVLCASWVEDASRSPAFAVPVAVLAVGAVRSGKRVAVCGGRLAVARADCPSEAEEVRNASAVEVEGFLDGVEAAVAEPGAEVPTGIAAGVAAMLAAVAGEELTAACTAAAIAACCVSVLGVVMGWALAGDTAISAGAGAVELKLAGDFASEALLSVAGGCVAEAGPGEAGVGVA